MIDLHRHDEFSYYDGSGKALELALIAKEKGLTSLGLSNHGNTSGLIQHYDACHEVGIKPVMGVESYFLPKYIEQTRGYHLNLFAKTLEGFKNMNQIQSEGEMQKYYNAIVDFEMLSRLHDDVICTTACIAGYLSQSIIKKNMRAAYAFVDKMVEIFGDDFYIEIQPYVVSEAGLQEMLNVEMIKIAKDRKVKLILTSDSHRGRKEDIEEYMKMHELKNQNPEYLQHVRETYSERYMPDKNEMQKRFVKMHSEDFGKEGAIRLAREMTRNLEYLEESVQPDIIDELASMPALPKYDEEQDSYELLKSKVKQGLIKKGLHKNKEYVDRAKEELRVIKANNFEDYFLIVQDYVVWAKQNGIIVGPGRGSGCNCLINFVLEITDVDPIFFELDFSRFIREDKKTLPDIDVDFETIRRPEVMKYIVDKYYGKAVQIASYGTYRVDNLINDLAKTYPELADAKETLAYFKKIVNTFQNDEKQIDVKKMLESPEVIRYDKIYGDFFKAFAFLYNKVKYLGTHAAGAAVSRDSICYYTAVRYDKKDDKFFSSYNLVDMERCGIIKYDILGLSTLSCLGDLRKITGKEGISNEDISDMNVINEFAKGNCTGIFQYGEKASQQMLTEIGTDCFNDVVAASAMNRPGPLSLGIPSLYAESKQTWASETTKPVYSEYIEDTYGCILYQEQINAIAVNYGGLSWNQADKLRKMDDPSSLKSRELLEKHYDEFLVTFQKGMKKYGLTADEAKTLFDQFLNYAFNKGHSVGYALISFEEMYAKVYYPTEFWATKLKFTDDMVNHDKFCAKAVADGVVVFLPHVNYSTLKTKVRAFEGEKCLQQGLSDLKGIGEKAAQYIEDERKKNGIFRSYDDFYDRCKSRLVTSRVVTILKDQGALEFNKKIYISRVTKYNSSLYGRSLKQ